MELDKLVVISNRFKSNFKNLIKPIDVFNKLKSQKIILDLIKMNILTGRDLFYLIFLIYLQNKNNSVDSILKLLTNFTFVIKVGFIDEIEPYDECENCGGIGEKNCFDCGGDGEIDCPECEYHDETCPVCDNFKTLTCPTCNERGMVECENCDGIGESVMYGKVGITRYSFLSVNPKLKDFLLDYVGNVITEDLFFKINDDDLTILIKNDFIITEEYYHDKYEDGDYILHQIFENPSIITVGNSNNITLSYEEYD